MPKEDQLPTEREWLLMEALWELGDGITSQEILSYVNTIDTMGDRTERVLLHHLLKKGMVSYTVDEKDSRVYHYYAKRTREECLAEKRRGFIDAYYRGNQIGAAASFLKDAPLTKEELKELERILRTRKNGIDEAAKPVKAAVSSPGSKSRGRKEKG